MLGEQISAEPLSRQAIYNYEKGKARVPAIVLLAAARLAGRDLYELLPELADPESRLLRIEREIAELRHEVAALKGDK